MALPSSIIVIEDDEDDVEILKAALDVLQVTAPLRVFQSGSDAYDYLNQLTDERPGLILCDMNLSRESGIDLRTRLAENEKLHNMTIPFVFMTTAIDESHVQKAFRLPVQGVFLKENSMDGCVDQLRTMLKYWSQSLTPNSPRPPGEWLKGAKL